MIYIVYVSVALFVLFAFYVLFYDHGWLKAKGKGIGYSEGINAKRLQDFADKLNKITHREK